VCGLVIALAPLGVKVLREGPVPRLRTLLGRVAGILLLLAAMAFAGTLG
jgi:hypothetical protein